MKTKIKSLVLVNLTNRNIILPDLKKIIYAKKECVVSDMKDKIESSEHLAKAIMNKWLRLEERDLVEANVYTEPEKKEEEIGEYGKEFVHYDKNNKSEDIVQQENPLPTVKIKKATSDSKEFLQGIEREQNENGSPVVFQEENTEEEMAWKKLMKDGEEKFANYSPVQKAQELKQKVVNSETKPKVRRKRKKNKKK